MSWGRNEGTIFIRIFLPKELIGFMSLAVVIPYLIINILSGSIIKQIGYFDKLSLNTVQRKPRSSPLLKLSQQFRSLPLKLHHLHTKLSR